jgi:phage FluMu protein Com
MKEIRCEKCGKLLFKKEGDFEIFEIKCPRCGHIQKIENKKIYIAKDEKGNEIGLLTLTIDSP